MADNLGNGIHRGLELLGIVFGEAAPTEEPGQLSPRRAHLGLDRGYGAAVTLHLDRLSSLNHPVDDALAFRRQFCRRDDHGWQNTHFAYFGKRALAPYASFRLREDSATRVRVSPFFSKNFRN